LKVEVGKLKLESCPCLPEVEVGKLEIGKLKVEVEKLKMTWGFYNRNLEIDVL
jgi:hypothetical protein